MKSLLFTLVTLSWCCWSTALQAEAIKFKDQPQSSFKWWSEMPIDPMLNFKAWKDDRDARDEVPDWENITRERNHRELVGRVFQCIGRCQIDRGRSFFNVNHRSALYEGDELQTMDESYVWIYLFDGTLVRLAPNSSVTFNELNIGEKENFFSARLNVGNILWLSRNEESYLETNLRETDTLFNPLAMYEAIAETPKKDDGPEALFESLSENSNFYQYVRLNKLIAENNLVTKSKKSNHFLVLPNITLMGKSLNVEVMSVLGGKSFFKQRSKLELGLKNWQTEEGENFLEEAAIYQLRGFENKELQNVQIGQWFEVDDKGRAVREAGEEVHWLTMGEFVTKRIPGILVGRELFLKKYSSFAFQEKYEPLKLAVENGYRFWSEKDHSDRLEFLKEYFRRIETSNLLASSRFKERLLSRGEKLRSIEFGPYYFLRAINHYSKHYKKPDIEETEKLNSTKKTLWKKMNGIK